MIIAKVQCKCGNWIRIRTMEEQAEQTFWNCSRKVQIKRAGGKGARVVGTCEGEKRQVFVEYEE